MKHDFLKPSNSKSILLNTSKEKGLQMGYIKLKGKIKYPDCEKTSEYNADSTGWAYVFSSAIKIWNCGEKITMKQMLHLCGLKNCYLVTYTGITRNGNITFKQGRGQRIIGSLDKILQSEGGLFSRKTYQDIHWEIAKNGLQISVSSYWL